MKRPPNIPEDKANHYIYTQLFSLVVYLLCKYNMLPNSEYLALASGAGLAIAWEAYQKVSKSGEPSIKDALWGFAGSVVLILPLHLLTV